jgi:hypothetical protein
MNYKARELLHSISYIITHATNDNDNNNDNGIMHQFNVPGRVISRQCLAFLAAYYSMHLNFSSAQWTEHSNMVALEAVTSAVYM